jgi:EAL domain-containing protein (putative c-di-GMP-specific phosphodiesterase class I)
MKEFASDFKLDFLKKKYCDEAQGYLLSQPLAALEFEQFLAKSNAFTSADCQ